MDEFVASLVWYSQLPILNPKRFVDEWISQVLNEAGKEGALKPDSLLDVTSVLVSGHRSTIFRKKVALRDIVRGVYETVGVNVRISWPAGFGETLTNRLTNDLNEAVTKAINDLFDGDKKQEIKKIYRAMARSAAISYISKQKGNRKQGTAGIWQKAFVTAVARFLNGDIEPALLTWKGKTVPGLLFISVDSLVGGLWPANVRGRGRTGVILSVLSGDYYEVGYPGLAASSTLPAEIPVPAAAIEKNPKFRDFMNRHRTPGIERALSAAGSPAEPFEYKTEQTSPLSAGRVVKRTAPFDVTASTDYVQDLIGVQKEELTRLFDDLVYSPDEVKRDQYHRIFSVLAIYAGVLLLAAGVAIGGPVLAYAAASIAITLGLEVVPNAVLYAYADDDEERALYLYSIIAAIAMEALGTGASAFAPMAKSAAFRLARGVATSARTRLPQLFDFGSEQLQALSKRLHVERLRAVAGGVDTLKDESIDALTTVVDALRRTGGNAAQVLAQARGASSRAAENGGGTAHRWSAQGTGRTQLELARQQLNDEGFDAWFRVVVRWDNPTGDKAAYEYVVVATRGDDAIVVTQSTAGKDFSYDPAVEHVWAKEVQQKAEEAGALVKYLDFADFELYKIEHTALYSGKRLSGTEYIENARTLSAPQAYREAVKKQAGIDYDDYQALAEKLEYFSRPSSKTSTASQGSVGAGAKQKTRKKPEMAEPIRILPPREGEIPNFTTDFDAEGLLENLKSIRQVEEALANPHAKCDTLLGPVGDYLRKNGFDDIRYRAMYMWTSASSDPTNHFAIVASKDGVDYVFDLSAAQFSAKMQGFSGPMIVREPDWAAKYDAGSERRLVKYRDFPNANTAINLFPQLPVPPGQTIEKATILKVPKWYLTLKNAQFEQFMKIPGAPESLSAQLGELLEQSGEALLSMPRSRADANTQPVLGAATLAAAQVQHVSELRREYFFAEPASTAGSESQLDERRLQIDTALNTSNVYSKLYDNLARLKLEKKPEGGVRLAVERVEKAFAVATDLLSKIAALMLGEEGSTATQERIFERLAVFLQETDPDILKAEYRRLQFLLGAAVELARYHRSMKTVVPLQLQAGVGGWAPVQAFVYEYDPDAKIMVVLGGPNNGTTSEDWQQLGNLSPPKSAVQHPVARTADTLTDVQRAQSMHGSVLFGVSANDTAQVGAGGGHDAASMQAQRELLAHAKMNDVDGLFVLLNDLYENFSFIFKGSEWIVVRVPEDRPKHDEPPPVSASAPNDPMFRQLCADVITAILIQAGQLDVGGLLNRTADATTASPP